VAVLFLKADRVIHNPQGQQDVDVVSELNEQQGGAVYRFESRAR
jgi:hypothetical protein